MPQILNPVCFCAAEVVFSIECWPVIIRSTACFNKVTNRTQKLFKCSMCVSPLGFHFISSKSIYFKQYVDIFCVYFYLFALTFLDCCIFLHALK